VLNGPFDGPESLFVDLEGGLQVEVHEKGGDDQKTARPLAPA
jgi:hypothetical protein